MGEPNLMFTLMTNTADSFTQALLNRAALTEQESVNNKLKESYEKETGKTYDAHNFKRVAMENEQALNTFITQMQTYGIYTNNLESDVKGQYIVEIENEVDTSTINNPALTTGAGQTVSAQEILDNFTQTSGLEFQEVENTPIQESHEILDDSVKAQSVDWIAPTLDTFGHAVYLVKGFSAFGADVSVDNNIFSYQNLKNRSDTGAYLGGDGSKLKIAIVSDGKVYVDGKQIQGCVAENVLKQHERRMRNVERYANKKAFTKTGRERKERAEKIKQSLYGDNAPIQEYQIAEIKEKNYTKALTDITKGIDMSASLGTSFTVSLAGDIEIDAKALKTDMLAFGITGHTADDLMKFNEQFIKKAEGLGIQFVGRHSKFDTEMLNKLTDNQLKKLGISDDTRKALAELNKCSAFRTPSLVATAAGVAASLGGRLSGVGADEESQQTFNELRNIKQNAKRGITYSQKAVVSARRVVKASQEALDAFRVSHMSPDKAKAFKQKQQAQAQKAAETRKINAKANEKYTKKHQKKRQKAEKRQDGLVAKISNKFNAAKMKLYNNPVVKALRAVIESIKSLLIKAVAAFFGVYIHLAFFMGAAVVVLSLVTSLVDFLKNPAELVDNLLAPEKMSDTAMWTLYEFMKGEEDTWVESLNSSIDDISYDYYSDDKAGEQKLLWGADYQSLKDYVNQFSNLDTGARADLVYDTSDRLLYINPFDKVGVTANNANFDNYATKVKEFDGTQDVYIGTNMNMFNLREGGDLGIDDDGYFGYSSIQNGHTSNVKDILCMTDVLYETEEDGKITSINNLSPAGTNWKEFKEDVKNFFQKFMWVGACLHSWLDDHDPPAKSVYVDNDHVSYQTISNYAETLFQASHQEQYDLKVEYYSVTGEKYDPNEGWTQSTLSQIGVCNNPEQGKFKIKFFDDFVGSDHHRIGTLAPYIVKDNGSELRLDKYNTNIRANGGTGISMDDITGLMGGAAHSCLWSLKITPKSYGKIDNDVGEDCLDNYIKGSNCWEKTENIETGKITTSKSSTGGDSYYKITGSKWSDYVLGDKVEAANANGYYDTKAEAKTSAVTALKNAKDNLFNNTYKNQVAYHLTSDNYTLTHNYYTKSSDSSTYTYTSMKVGTGEYYDSPIYFNNFDVTTNGKTLTYVGAENGNYENKDPSTGATGLYYVGEGKGRYVYTTGSVYDTTGGEYGTYSNNSTTVPVGGKQAYMYFDASKDADGYNVYITLSDGTKRLRTYDDIKNKGYQWYKANCRFMYFSSVNDNWCKDLDCYDYLFYVKASKKLVETKTVYKCTGTTNVADYHTDTYKHDCQGHIFEYCGGHVCVRVSGNVFSITNEQLVSVGAVDESIMPQALDYETKAKDNYGSIIGKYDKNEINYDSVETARTSVTGVTYAENIYQGSVVGQFGLNLNVDGENWEEGFEKNENFDKVKNQLRDIFDVDCMIDKGPDCFPISSHKDYEGWTADNMSLVLLKFSMDWKEMYGFDLPLEIGDAIVSPEPTSPEDTPEVTCDGAGYTLSENDIDLIVESIKAQRNSNGHTVTAKQEEAIRFTLRWVGRGHYNTGHDSHNFLTESDAGETYTIRYHTPVGDVDVSTEGQFFNCTAGTSFEFANFVMRSVGAINNSELFQANRTNVRGMQQNESIGSLEPMTVLMHYPLKTITHFNELSVYGNVEDYPNNLAAYPDIQERMILYNKPQAIIFLGVLNNEDITLSTGQKLKNGTPIFVDMECINGVGNTWLHNGTEDTDVADSRLDPTKLYDWLYDTGSLFDGTVVQYYNADDWK